MKTDALFKIKIDKETLTLNEIDAQKVYDFLHRFFGPKTVWTYPTYTYTGTTITCDSNSDLEIK